MSESIQCNFARCAVRYFMSAQLTKRNQLPRGKMPVVIRNYNKHFTAEDNLQVSCSQASKKFPVICKLFSNKWNPKELRESYISAFGIEAWSALTADEKAKHTLQRCSACLESYPSLSAAFPTPRRKAVRPRGRLISKAVTESTTIKLSKKDLSSPSNLGRKVLQDLNRISLEKFQKSGQELLTITPKSQLQKKPTKQERRQQKRKIEKEVKCLIEKDKQDCACDIVLGTRISWSAYDKIRKAEGLTHRQKRLAGDHTSGEPTAKRRHGNIGQIAQTQLLEEAASWPPDKRVNWSSLAREYGIHALNGGQILKEFLQEHNVPAALIVQRATRAPRRCKKKLGSGKVSFPMYPTVVSEHHKIQQRIESGDIEIGKEIVTTTQTRYSVDKSTKSVVIDEVEVSARKIPLTQIRQNLLKKHEALGVIRDLSEDYFEALTMHKVISRL